MDPRAAAAPSSPAPRPAGDSAALPREGQLPDPADAPGRKRRGRGRGQGGAHTLLPQAGAVDREARVSVGPRRNHDGGHQDEVRGGAQALPLPRVRLDRGGHHGGVSADRALAAAGRHARAPAAQRGGRLLEGAARDPGQEEGHLEPSERGPPLLHVVRPRPLPRGAHLAGAEEDRELLGLLLLPRHDPPRTPPRGLAARSGRRGGGLLRPADGPPRELRQH